jgi:hypothetical protein
LYVGEGVEVEGGIVIGVHHRAVGGPEPPFGDGVDCHEVTVQKEEGSGVAGKCFVFGSVEGLW